MSDEDNYSSSSNNNNPSCGNNNNNSNTTFNPIYVRRPVRQLSNRERELQDNGYYNPDFDNRRPLTAFPAHIPRATAILLFVTQNKIEELRAAFENNEVCPNDFVYPDDKNCGGMTLMHLAVTNKKMEILRILLEYGCDPDPQEKNCNYTPLTFCVITRDEHITERAEMARLLCQYGANPGHRTKFGASVLDLAVQCGVTTGTDAENQMLSVLRRALSERLDREERERQEEMNNNKNHLDPTASNIVLDNRERVEQERLQRERQEAAARRKRSEAVNPHTIMSAIVQGKMDVLKGFEEFIDAEFVNTKVNNLTYLTYAATTGQVQSLEWLLDKGAEIDERGARGENCLFSAIMAGSKECSLALVNRGSDLSIKAFDGRTCYALALRAFNFQDIVKAMLAKITNNTIEDPSQVPDYFLSLIKSQNTRMMRVLHECDVISSDALKAAHPSSPNVFYLHFAAENGKADSVRELIELGVNIDQQNKIGNTALHVAIKAKQPSCVEVLIDANANMEIRNGTGESVTDCAIRGRNDQIIRAVEAGWKKFVKSGRSNYSGSNSNSGSNNNNQMFGFKSMNFMGGGGGGSGSGGGSGIQPSSSGDDYGMNGGGGMGAPAMTNGMLIQSTLSVVLDDLTLAYLSRFPRNFIFDVTDVELQQHLASGGGGTVHLAKIKSQDRLVAAKIFRDADSIRKTVDECERAVKLHHKNIVKHVGLTVSKSAFSTDLVLLMELGEGSLQDALRSAQGSTQFDFDTIYSFMKQVAEGLMYLHAKQMLWLDGKPGNLLFFDNRTTLKLIDFGLSRDISKDKTHDTVSRAGAGTLRYMSKSQLHEEQVRKTDDIYSYGATFYNLVCGVEPWAGASMPQIMTGNLIDHFEPRPGCPQVLAAVVRACLAVDPKDRPQDGAELLRLLLPEGAEMPNAISMGGMVSSSDTGNNNGNDDDDQDQQDVTEQIDMDVTW